MDKYLTRIRSSIVDLELSQKRNKSDSLMPETAIALLRKPYIVYRYRGHSHVIYNNTLVGFILAVF